jgi:DNA-binding MarR family transcriptional regulator
MLQREILCYNIFMADYLSEVLHIEIAREKYANANKLPLILRAQFRYEQVSLNGVVCLVAAPKDALSLPNLKKLYRELQKQSGLLCIYELQALSQYAEDRLMNEGIAFYVVGGAVYLPFSGVFLPGKHGRTIEKAERLSFLAQRLLRSALYQKWNTIISAEIANSLRVSPMSVTRALDDLEGIGLPFVAYERRKRFFSSLADGKEYFAAIEPYLRNPVKKTLRLANAPKEKLRFGGISAVCHYSMLSDNAYPTFAVTQQELHDMDIADLAEAHREDEPAAILQVVGYMIGDYDKQAVDPLSAILSLSDAEKDDDRVAITTRKIKEKIL